MGTWVYVKCKKTKPHEPGHWSEKKQLEVVTTYLALGNLSETSRVCNVPMRTVTLWKSQEWWSKLVNDIQSGEGQRTDNKMSKTIDKALDMLMERMEQGDYQYDQKTGRLVKVPLKARDLGQADRLAQLATQFAQLVGQKVEPEKLVNEYIEGEFTHDREASNSDICDAELCPPSTLENK